MREIEWIVTLTRNHWLDRVKEKSGREAFSEDAKVKATLEEEALLASPQPVAKPANILFCNWAEPEEEVQSIKPTNQSNCFVYADMLF